MMTHECADIVIPTYGERGDSLARTVQACLSNSDVLRVLVVDDGSPTPVRRFALPLDERVHLIHLPQNVGISAARNAGLRASASDFVAFVNVEALIEPNWVRASIEYLRHRPRVGATFCPLKTEGNDLKSRWRMRFQEEKFDVPTGPRPFAPGHAVMFRREALAAVGGYDEARRRAHEDSDVCRRLREHGWEIHIHRRSFVVSIQDNSIERLAKTSLIRLDVDVVAGRIPRRAGSAVLRALVNRVGRNIVRGRLSFLSVDLLVFLESLRQLRLYGAGLRSRGRRL